MTKLVEGIFLSCALVLPMGVGAQTNQEKPRIFVADSDSWQMVGDRRGFAGGARPQTAEIIKTFGQRCPGTLVTMKKENADYFVVLQHEGGKAIVYRDNKFALFNGEGDVIKSGSTRSLGNSVKDACSAITSDWPGSRSAIQVQRVPEKELGPIPETAKPQQEQVTPSPEPTPMAIMPVAVAGSSGPDATVTVSIRSSPAGADIEVDGKFVGNTPSMVQVRSGDHNIAIKKPGFQSWQRAMALTVGSSINVDAVLQVAVAVQPTPVPVQPITESKSPPPPITSSSVQSPEQAEKPVVSAPAKTDNPIAQTIQGDFVGGPLPPKRFEGDEARQANTHKWMISGMDIVWVPAGSFTMGGTDGESDERPVHRVTLTDGFWMGTHEVTQLEWFAVMGTNPSSFTKCGKDCPVENVSWDDVQSFLGKLNAKNDGFVYSLPTEAQWEYAARAGAAVRNNPSLDDAAWFGKNSGGMPHAVGTKRANAFGLYDMNGNVWEWCSDWYGKYDDRGENDPSGPAKGKLKVIRGGAWKDGTNQNRYGYRSAIEPGKRDNNTGFRVVARVR